MVLDPLSMRILNARCLWAIEYFGFSNFHGEPQARIDHRMKLYAEKFKHPQLLNFMTFLFFYAPRAYIKDLYQVVVDGRAPDQASWQEFFVRLIEEWQSILLLGEVLLAVNISFVAIPSVDISNQGNFVQSISQIFSYISSVAVFGSIVSGLVLVRRSSVRQRDSAEEAINFYMSVENAFLGIEGLVITYSLPYALLIWSILSFAAGFCVMCFKATNFSTRLSVGLAVSITFLLVIWSIIEPQLWSKDSSESESTSHR